LEDQPAVDLVRAALASGTSPATAANQLVTESLARGSTDNVSAVVVVFKPEVKASQPTASPTAISGKALRLRRGIGSMPSSEGCGQAQSWPELASPSSSPAAAIPECAASLEPARNAQPTARRGMRYKSLWGGQAPVGHQAIDDDEDDDEDLGAPLLFGCADWVDLLADLLNWQVDGKTGSLRTRWRCTLILLVAVLSC
jgi:hypothetical protein